MSAAEGSDIDENLDSSSSFISYQPVQGRSPAPAAAISSESDIEAEPLRDIDQDHHSDESFLPSSGDSHNSNANELHDQNDFSESEDPYTAAKSYYTRPNRYYGPASTWRSWTKDDRNVAESLELERAQDLSIHLYNAHVLRLQAQRLQQSSSRKRRRGTSETDVDEDEIFEVPKVWTAWPMPPSEVPRDFLDIAAANARPSRELEDCLISATTRVARERWNTRAGQEDDIDQQNPTEEHDQQAAAASDISDYGEIPEIQKSELYASTEDESSPEISDDASADDVYGIDTNAKPVPLADDDKARVLLLPSTRHVISKLDHLLWALHCARQSYALPVLRDGDGRAASSATDVGGQSSASRKSRQRSHAQRASSISTVNAEASASTLSSRRRKGVWKKGSVPHSRKFKGLALRDWSDMLGMAALTGWDEDIVARASRRCAELFGEEMLFRRFHEAEQSEERSFFTEILASGKEPLDNGKATDSQVPRTQRTDEGEDSQTEGTAGLLYACPIKTCQRHKTPFRTAGNLELHMAHDHVQSEAEDEKYKTDEATIHDHTQILCPIKICHRSRKPFTRGSKLYLHVRKMHPEVNVEDLKKLESQRRGETRGKWIGDRRKRNSYERS